MVCNTGPLHSLAQAYDCAIINGMVKQGYPADAIASNPPIEKLTALQSSCGIRVTQDNNAAVEWADVIVLAVKPQVMEVACNTFNHQNLTQKPLYPSPLAYQLPTI